MSDNQLNLKISTPYGVEFEDSIVSATFKTTEGFITILKDHISIIGELFECEMMINTVDNKEIKLNVGKGSFANINNNLKIITSSCNKAEAKQKKSNDDDYHLQFNEVKANGYSYTEMTLEKNTKED